MEGATMPGAKAGTEDSSPRPFEISFPTGNGRDQDEEFCEIFFEGETKRVRFHDYDEIYSIPGFYEQLFYTELQCQSPPTVAALVRESLPATELEPGELRMLDVGAGNGMVGEEFSDLGMEALVGVDIIPEAFDALERDRPGLYDDYHVIDLTDIPEGADEKLSSYDFNLLTTVAALGFDDIPPEAFTGGYQYLREGGLIAISIKADFVDMEDASGFARMIDDAIDEGALEVKGRKRFTHRLSTAGDPIPYVAIVAEKRSELVIPTA